MKLSTKILLLIAPVILFSAISSSYIIYINQKQALVKLESNALQLDMEKLSGHFQQAASFLNSYSYTLTHSEILRQYFLNKNNPYRELELVDNLQETIDVLQSGDSTYTALAIADANFNVLYYAENSDDPFADIDPLITEDLESLYQQDVFSSHSRYVLNSQGQGLLVKYQALDKRTLTEPLNYDNENIIFLIFSVSLEPFNQLRQMIEYNHQTAIIFTETPIVFPSSLVHSVELASELYATVDPATFLLKDKLDTIWFELIYACIGSAFLTIILVLTLLHYNVIKPISKLDRQLKEVENKHRSNIDKLSSNDEVGRLSTRFFEMYQELDNTYQKTKRLAETDQLTGLVSRAQYQQLIDTSIENSLRSDKAWVLYLDLDNFKFVNDKYGHQVGDALLVEFADTLVKQCLALNNEYQGTSYASRLSGDEFSVFITSDCPNDSSLGELFSNTLLAPLQEGFVSEVGTFPITASIGIANYPEDGVVAEKLISNADTAMYQAKRAGKNQLAQYSLDLDKTVQRRGDIEHALRSNEFDHEFSLVFMPYLNQRADKVIGVEALLRWNSSTLGFVSPNEFIPIAEQTGLFEKIDRWVIRNAFETFNQIQSIFGYEVQMAVNLSSAELGGDKLANYISEQALINQIPYHLIDFEITETFAADTYSFPLLDELSCRGFQLAVDDFGSGYTSFTQLVKYPVQKIKLDRLFLMSLIENKKTQIIKPLIELCHSQSMIVTAEGIEDEYMHNWLAEANCDLMQGFYFCKPLPIEQLEVWLQEKQL